MATQWLMLVNLSQLPRETMALLNLKRLQLCGLPLISTPICMAKKLQCILITLDVQAILNTPSPSGKHACWWSKVYGAGVKKIDIVYRSGRMNIKADALSRNP